jgi:hypothetical protein
MKRITGIIVLLTCFLSAVQAQEYRDVVFLKNGSVIKGFYKELYPNDSLRMETIDGGVLVCAFSDVERIAKERTSLYVVNVQEDIDPPIRTWRPKGYRGFLEYGQDTNSKESKIVATGLITVHGYQLNRNLFVGGGFGLQHFEYREKQYVFSMTENTMPVFADVQFSFLRTRIAPFIEGRAGYSVTGLKGLYCNPSAGVNFGITPRMGGYLSLGYSLQEYKENDEKNKLEGLSFHMGLYF